MAAPRILLEEEVRAAARQGEDAVLELVFGLVNNWMNVLQQLEERVQALEDQSVPAGVNQPGQNGQPVLAALQLAFLALALCSAFHRSTCLSRLSSYI